MRTISEPGWDGPVNLRTAVRAAASPDSAGRGVLVTVGEEIHAAAEVTKWHTQSLAAFRSPHGAIGAVERGAIRFLRPPRRGLLLEPRRIHAAVDLHVVAVGVDDRLIRASLARGARGLVVEATGCGNVPPAVLPGLRAALSSGVPVVVVSRCPEGRVAPAYGYEGGGQRLRDMGVILAGELPGPKARILLMVALGVTRDLAALRGLFEAAAVTSTD